MRVKRRLPRQPPEGVEVGLGEHVARPIGLVADVGDPDDPCDWLAATTSEDKLADRGTLAARVRVDSGTRFQAGAR